MSVLLRGRGDMDGVCTEKQTLCRKETNVFIVGGVIAVGEFFLLSESENLFQFDGDKMITWEGLSCNRHGIDGDAALAGRPYRRR